MPVPGTSPAPSRPSGEEGAGPRDPYQGVVLVLLTGTLLGTAAALAGGLTLGSPALLDAAVTLGISTGILMGVWVAQTARAHAQEPQENIPPNAQGQSPADAAPTGVDARPASSVSATLAPGVAAIDPVRGEDRLRPGAIRAALLRAGWFRQAVAWKKSLQTWVSELDQVSVARTATAAGAVVAIVFVLLTEFVGGQPSLLRVATGAALCLFGAGLAATAVHYLSGVSAADLPEAPGLCQGARLVAWVLVLAAVALAFGWAGIRPGVRAAHVVTLAINLALCYGLLTAEQPNAGAPPVFPLDLGVVSVVGGRTNVFASVLDAAEPQLGIDLRSTWALTVVRRSLEPLLVALAAVGWLTTSLTVVGPSEQGLVERLGVPVAAPPLSPGLHLHWPWPIDRVIRLPVQRVQAIEVGHEGEEAGGPENVLWAVEHAPNEYTLVLGDGRDLITVDAAVQYRIADARAWRYHCQNPEAALKAIAYRAVMRNTVDRTLADALSENLKTTTARMRAMVQGEADALGLGIEVLDFTVGGMHPPVPVAPAYQAVVSAQVGRVTAVVNAQAYRNQTIPFAETAVIAGLNVAKAEAADALGRAAGEAWSFRTLEAQYRLAPQEYFFRRRLETLEQGLAGRSFTVVDTRFQRDGGELWVIP